MFAEPIDLTDATFAATIAGSENRLILVDCWAQWCAPCKALAPVLTELARDYADEVLIAKVDIEANPATRDALDVTAIPLLVLYRDGTEVARHNGALTKSRLAAFVEGALA